MKNYLLFFFIFILASEVNSSCNFPTGYHIDKLSNPSNIQFIKIDTPNSSKYAQNVFRIVTSKSRNIPDELKINFKANISVHYNFGICKYSGRVRQSGDLKDHIILRNGQPIRSLDVKLKEGNILNAVRFKLLIPNSRNGLNEILATLILKNLGFIAPDTFEVRTSINGVNSVMLFQEKETKELLEKNLRREGPIFEGDESILWTYDNYDIKDHVGLSLLRLVNDNWFKKGRSSQAITINSFSNLQKIYFKNRYAYIRDGGGGWRLKIFPNSLKNKYFIDFHTLLLAMNANHAFYLHNRKYYFNAIESTLEPIYYDGNPNFLSAVVLNETDIELLPSLPSTNLSQSIKDLNRDNELLNKFLLRTINKEISKEFFLSSFSQFQENLINIVGITSKQVDVKSQKTEIDIPKNWYQELQISKGLNQEIIEEIIFHQGSYKGRFADGKLRSLTTQELANILSKSKLRINRTVYIPSEKKEESDKEVNYVKFKDKSIRISNGMKVKFEDNKKTIKFTQSNPSDWALLLSGDYSNWNIIFEGLPFIIDENSSSKQRFNQYGLTGCLTIYESLIHNASLSVTGGACEDSINIINSLGDNVSLIVENAFADALDADFSKLSIKSIEINNARNDCIDFSGGNYNINKAVLNGCKDKAISVGEKSKLNADQIFAKKSTIAISAKDLSNVKISILDVKDVTVCAEVKQKKQEFGGANLLIKNYKCPVPINIDTESQFLTEEL